MNQNTVLLQDKHNPSVKFNLSKYFEFKYNAKMCNVNTRDLEEVEAYIKQLDVQALYALDAPQDIKRSPFLITIDLILKEIDDRMRKGYLPGGLDATEKNRLAMKLVDLHDRVRSHPKKTLDDPRLKDLSIAERKFNLNKIEAQRKADDYQQTLQVLIDKKNKE